MRWRTVGAVVVLLTGLVVAALAAPVLWLTIDEAAVPPASEAPALPEGVTAESKGVSCASGGCWREWTLSRPPSPSGRRLAERLDLSEESCVPPGLLDRRRVCTWVNVVGGEVHLYVQYDRPLD